MFVLLILVIVLLAVGAVVALVRGLLAFAREGDRIKGGDDAHILRGEQQNRMMTQRVMFQAGAILVVVLLATLFAAN